MELDLFKAKQLVKLFRLQDMASVQKALWHFKDHMNGSEQMNSYQFLHALYKLIPNHLTWIRRPENIQHIVYRFMTFQNNLPRCGVVIICQNHILILKSVYGKHMMFPMGKQNPNEPNHECANRECLEETGLDLQLHQNSDFITFNEKSQSTRHMFFSILSCDIDSIIIRPQCHYEVSEYKWVTIDWFKPNKPFRSFNNESWATLIQQIKQRLS